MYVSPVTVSTSITLHRIRHTKGDNNIGKGSCLFPKSKGINRLWLGYPFRYNLQLQCTYLVITLSDKNHFPSFVLWSYIPAFNHDSSSVGLMFDLPVRPPAFSIFELLRRRTRLSISFHIGWRSESLRILRSSKFFRTRSSWTFRHSRSFLPLPVPPPVDEVRKSEQAGRWNNVKRLMPRRVAPRIMFISAVGIIYGSTIAVQHWDLYESDECIHFQEGPVTHLCLVLSVCRGFDRKRDFAGPPRTQDYSSGIRWCPYGATSIQVSKFPRAHIPLIRDSSSIFELVGLIFRGPGNPS